MFRSLCVIHSIGSRSSSVYCSKPFLFCATASLGWLPLVGLSEIFLHYCLLFTCKGLLAIVQSWSFGYSAHAHCYCPIQELCLRWPLSLEPSSRVPAHGITIPLTSPAAETP